MKETAAVELSISAVSLSGGRRALILIVSSSMPKIDSSIAGPSTFSGSLDCPTQGQHVCKSDPVPGLSEGMSPRNIFQCFVGDVD